MPITIHKLLVWELHEQRPTLLTRIYDDSPDKARAHQWPDPKALTRAQALDLVTAIQDTVLHQDHLHAFPPRLTSGLRPTPENAT